MHSSSLRELSEDVPVQVKVRGGAVSMVVTEAGAAVRSSDRGAARG
jgi:hypothetical protein